MSTIPPRKGRLPRAGSPEALTSGLPEEPETSATPVTHPTEPKEYYLQSRRARDAALRLMAAIDIATIAPKEEVHTTSRGAVVLTYTFTSLGTSVQKLAERDWLIYLEEYSKLLSEVKNKNLKPSDLKELQELISGGLLQEEPCAPEAVLVLVDSKRGSVSLDDAGKVANELVPGSYAATKPSLIFELVRVLGTHLGSLHPSGTVSVTVGRKTDLGEYPRLFTLGCDVSLSFVSSVPKFSQGRSFYAFCGTRVRKV